MRLAFLTTEIVIASIEQRVCIPCAEARYQPKEMSEVPILKGLLIRLLPSGYLLGLQLLSHRERAQAVALLPLVAVSAVVDMVAMSALLPMMAAIFAPGAWLTGSRFGSLLSPLLPADPNAMIVMLIAGVIGLLIVAAVLNVVTRKAINSFNAKCRIRLTNETVERLLNAPYSWFLITNSALTTRAVSVDIARWGMDFVGRIFSITQTLVLGAVAALLVAFVAPLAGAITAIAVLSLAIALSMATRARMRHYTEVERLNLDRSVIGLTQLLAGIKDVKLSGTPDQFAHQATDSTARLTEVQTQRNTLRQVLPVLTLLTGQVAMILVIGVLWWLKRPVSQIAEQMVFLALVSARLLPAANRLFLDFSVLWDVLPYVKNVHKLTAALSSTTPSSRPTIQGVPFPAQWLAVEGVNLGYRYPESTAASLSGVNLTIRRGAAYGLAGPSGAGKTTLVDILLRLLDPSQGKLVVDGIDAASIPLADWRSRIGYVAQQPFVTDDTLLANIAFGVSPSEVDRDLATDCLRRANLESVVDDLPQGLDTRLGERGIRLSGGQRQRVAIARALYKRPEILILDEATSALDSIAERAIQDAINQLHGDVTLIVIAHRISTIQGCDEIWLLESGGISATGTYAELLEKSELFRRLATSGESLASL
jgi:ABC-type multidrug transport system fused ATPase/permease subunit